MGTMAGNGGMIRVVNNTGASMVVTITLGGGTPTAYTDAALTTTHAMPKTVTATTDFYFRDPGSYTVSVTVNGREVAADPDGELAVTLGGGNALVFEPVIDQTALTDLSGLYAALNTGGIPYIHSDTAETEKFGTVFGLMISRKRNAIIGIAVNDQAASTAAYPTGVTGYGKNVNDGNQSFGIFGRADQYGTGVSTNEVNVFNYKGNPSTSFPPNRAIGTTQTVPVALTVATGGSFPAWAGIHIAQEGSAPQQMATGIYIESGSIRDYPLRIEGGSASFPSLILGAGTQRSLGAVAAAFGQHNTDNATGAQLLVGSETGNTPFIAASTYNGGTAADLVLKTNNTNRVRITGAGAMNVVTGPIQIAGTQVVTSRRTGWAAATGTATRTTYDTASVTLPQLAERVKALIDDLTTHGLIGT